MRELIVFTNSRNIREFVKKYDGILLPKITTIGVFFSEILYNKTKTQVFEISRVLYLNEAVKKTENLEKKLNIRSQFFEFLQNKEYLFSFFKELSDSKKTINDLKSSDIYSEYEEHLEILDELFNNYKEILDKNGVYDDITLPFDYEIDESYIRSFDKITIKIDGILTNFNIEILDKIRNFTNVILKFKASDLNSNLVLNLEKLSSLEIELGFSYELNLSTNTLNKISPLPSKKSIKLRGFKSQTLQALYVYTKISSFIRAGILPEDIVVILPDESFSEILKLYDFNNMLNFAMGFKFKNTLFYKIFSEILECLKSQKELDLTHNYLQNDVYTKTELFLNKANLSSQIYENFKKNYDEICDFNQFKSLINSILTISGESNLSEILDEVLFEIEIFLRSFTLKFSEICEIFSMLIRSKQIDHVGGGKVSVMGLLESRGMKFRAVIIPEFNDNLVPSRVVNEMFLNSEVRKRAGLISYTQRENLQRFYYKSLIEASEFTAICYKNSNSEIPSRFLKEFEVVDDNEFSDSDYMKLLETSKTSLNLEPTDIKIAHDFFKEPLSFSRLNDYIKCPKMYAYKRIFCTKEAKNVDKENTNLTRGTSLHEIVANSYENNKFDYQKFCALVDSKFLGIYGEIVKENFKNFNIDLGGIVEHEVDITNKEFEGIFIKGKIDRVEKTAEDIYLTDYKLGKLDSATKSFQLAFYQALLGIEESINSYFSFTQMSSEPPHKDYNLETLKEKISQLKEISGKVIKFEENHNFCRNCPYTLICKRSVNG